MKNIKTNNEFLSAIQSKRSSRGFILFFVVAIFAICCTIQTFAATTSVLGDQDYADGDIIGSNSTWTTAQTGEPYPFDTIHVAPKTIVFTHTGLDTGREGILTFSLWDLDAEFAGSQVVAFSLDGIPQDISAFELPVTDLRVNVFSFLIDPGFLSDGELTVSLSFEEPPAGNEVGIDFSRVDVLPTPVLAPDIQRWSSTNGFYALTFFGDGTLLATSDTFVSGAGSGVKLNPSDGSVIDSFFGPDVRVSVRLSTGDQDWVVGGYAGRRAVRQDGTLVRGLMEYLGCCNIPRFPMALDMQRDAVFVQANGELFGANMTTGELDYHFYGAGDTFGMISIANTNLLFTAGRSGNVTRLHPVSGQQWMANIASGDLQPGAVAADDSFIVSSGSPHFAGATSPGRLARILPDGTIVWNNMVNAVTPPVIGANGIIFVGTQPAPVNENGPGAINGYDPITGNLVWSSPVQGLPNDLLVGDDGAVYAGTGSFSGGRVYALGQSDGAVRQTITNVPGAWEIVLRAGLLYASGASITALPVEAVNYDQNSPWPIRFHDNQRTSNRTAPILNPPRDTDPNQEFPITVNPNNYTGRYYIADFVNPQAGPFTGQQTLNLRAGNYAFDNGNSVGNSSFSFTVDNTGQITNISNPAAATAIGSTLLLNNTAININPQAYSGRYNFLSFNTHYTGARSFTVIPGLRYGIDNGTAAGTPSGRSYFYFDVGTSGEVSNVDIPDAAYGDGNTLYFNNRTLIVEPGGYTGNYNLSSHYNVNPYVSGQHSFVLIPGLIYGFDAGTGSYEWSFRFDASGSPTYINPVGFATGQNNTLVLANVPVHIDPTNYGGNYRLNDRIFSGMQDQVLIPGVQFYVSVNNSAGYFKPTQTTVTPQSVTLDPGGNAYVFNFFVQPEHPLCTDVPTYTAQPDVPTPGRYQTGLAVGDFNKDGNQDILFSNGTTNNVSLRLGNGNGGFSGTSDFGTPDYPWRIVTADFNNDGNLDYAVAGNNSGLSQVRLGDGNGGFDGGTNIQMTWQAAFITSADFNGDGNADLASSSGGYPPDGIQVAVRLGDGSGGFGPIISVPVGTVLSSIVAGDFNGDSRADLAIADYLGNKVAIRLSNRAGGFTAAPDVPVGSGARDIGIGDFNNDGTLDLAVTNQDSDSISTRLGNGYGNFLPGTEIATGDGAYAVVIADLNNDGNDDILESDVHAQTIGVLLGDGFGGFNALPDVLADVNTNVIAVGDFNNDGIKDFASGNNYGYADRIKIFTGGCTSADAEPPSTNAQPSVLPNAAGWNKTDVGVTLTAGDNAGGSGVQNITYSTSGAQTSAPTTVSGSVANLTISAEGETTVSYFARDNAGNTEAAQSLVVKIDKTAPLMTSSATAGGNPYTAGTWTNQSVVVSFDCTDGGSGVADVTQPETLNNEGADQSASGTCTDVAGNNADLSFTDIDIDKTAPTISVSAPTNGNYLLNQAVTVGFECNDSLSGVSSCNGTNSNGSLLDTASIGPKTFTVNASDNAGNNASPSTVNYTVAFGIEVLFDQTKAHKAGSTVPIKIKLVDANGVNVSSAATVVHAVSVIQIGSQASPILDDPGNSNPDLDFRYQGGSVGGQYHFNLKTTGYGTGTYRLNFIAGNSPTIYSVQFQVRK